MYKKVEDYGRLEKLIRLDGYKRIGVDVKGSKYIYVCDYKTPCGYYVMNGVSCDEVIVDGVAYTAPEFLQWKRNKIISKL